ncbi:hypothetical protein O3Q52_08300 [Streptomyces sp. ActVer]|nr:hypothetical protein [Streptomyces sp. ActVer]MCZ4508203.1 hypothetical protein [Streptomyces sp. ActVer]
MPALGAVARECVRHAACPVVTVLQPPPDARAAEFPWVFDETPTGVEHV